MGAQSYTLGKGRLMFKPDVAGVEGKSYLRLGNAHEFTMTLTTEKLEHFSSMEGLQLKDASIFTKTSLMRMEASGSDAAQIFTIRARAGAVPWSTARRSTTPRPVSLR